MPLSFTLPPCICYANNLKKFCSVTLWPCLMQPLRTNSPWKMKDMRVEVKISTYPLLSDELPESTMFQVMKTYPSNLLLHTPQLPASHITSLYTARYHLVTLTMKKVLQFTSHLITTPYSHRKLHGLCTVATIQVHLHCMWWLRQRRRGRFTNSHTRWPSLDYRPHSR